MDATNIERNLYLTTQLIETGIPVVIALNMADLMEKNSICIDTERLGMLLGCPIVKTSALKGAGLKEVVDEAVHAAKKREVKLPGAMFSRELEAAIDTASHHLEGTVEESRSRWYAIKLLESDPKAAEGLSLSASARKEIEDCAKAMEKIHDDDMESIVTDERYRYIQKLVSTTVKKIRSKADPF